MLMYAPPPITNDNVKKALLCIQSNYYIIERKSISYLGQRQIGQNNHFQVPTPDDTD